ncbi:MAG TPA: lipase maturation factor family protein, partial [Polyangiaceae bacterium]
LVFRIMVGAFLIKIRNDSCWRDLTCLDFHFETQPNPNPLAWYLHHAPHSVHVAGVVFNHLAEGLAPWFIFSFRRWRHVAGAVLVLFQVSLILSGNLSFLNWLTIVPALACFDDRLFARLLPRARREKLLARFAALPQGKAHHRAVAVYGIVVAVLSVMPALNLVSSEQAMNSHFDPLDIVNTYGAFGSVDRRRFEVVLEGTRDESPGDATHDAHWEEYELPCQPGDVRRAPCIVTPYHYRLDWQMWFVGNDAERGETIEDEPWLVHLVWQLLEGDPSPRSLLARNPFPDAPPRWIRARIWEYRFSATRAGGAWWERDPVGVYIGPVSTADPALRAYVRGFGWAVGSPSPPTPLPSSSPGQPSPPDQETPRAR